MEVHTASQQPNGIAGKVDSTANADESNPPPTTASQPQTTQTQPQHQTQSSAQRTNPSNPQQSTSQQHKPRDVRLLHSLLASQGVSAYQDQVPLMLLDFAYRYTRSVLSDAQQITWEGYGATSSGNQNSGRAADAPTDISLQALRLAAQGRQIVLGSGSGVGGVGAQKADLLELSQETNRVGLPRVEREFGIRLPEERFILTGPGFGLKEEWVEIDDDEDDGMELDEEDDAMMLEGGDDGDEDGDEVMLGSDAGDDAEFEEVMGIKPDGDGKMVDL
jgi:transcription initiation factor TFIID subunit 9B